MKAARADRGTIRRGKVLSLREGGWVLLLAGAILLALVVWATAPAFLRKASAPPGDGTNIESYGFDLSNLAVRRDLVVPALLHRDMLPTLDFPAYYAGSDITNINAQQRGKYIVSSDRVIGIVLDGQPLAYPLSVMNVHEIVNDAQANTDFVITYNWQCDSPRVYRRTLADGSSAVFGQSGLFYNSNTLLYDKPPESAEGVAPASHQASLWSQFTGECVAGPRVGQRLQPIDCQLTCWSMWLAMHPETLVIQPDPDLRKRYQRGNPDIYFLSDEINFPIAAPARDSGLPVKARVVRVVSGAETRSLPVGAFFEHAGGESAAESIGDVTLNFHLDRAHRAVYLSWEPANAAVHFQHALRFAWDAFDAASAKQP